MVFRHRYRTMKYVVIPAERSVVNGITHVKRGIMVEFNGNIFDSDRAAAQNAWPAKVKKQVEDFLLACPDLGRSMWKDEDTPASAMIPHRDQAGERRLCAWKDIVEGAAEACGRPTFANADYCASHLQRLMQLSGAEEQPEDEESSPARLRQPVGMGVE